MLHRLTINLSPVGHYQSQKYRLKQSDNWLSLRDRNLRFQFDDSAIR